LVASLAQAPLDSGDCSLAGSTLQFCDPRGADCTTAAGVAGTCTQRRDGCECVARKAPPAKVEVCHREGNGSYHSIVVSSRAVPAHLAHGDCVVASDGVACTVERCDEDEGCVSEADDSLCDDGDVCNGVEVCDVEAEGCVEGEPLDCDDNNACTADSCDPDEGCVNEPITPCCGNGILEAGEQCEFPLGCAGGQCIGCICQTIP
jgi:hypothetical protein